MNTWKILSFAAACSLAGCVQQLVYPGTGTLANAKLLGPVQACKGGNCCYEKDGHNHCEWPLSLKSSPPEFDVQYSLRQAAAKKYDLLSEKIVLDVINLKITAEGDGTVRGWDATTTAYSKMD